jgi:hypothetical protein
MNNEQGAETTSDNYEKRVASDDYEKRATIDIYERRATPMRSELQLRATNGDYIRL